MATINITEFKMESTEDYSLLAKCFLELGENDLMIVSEPGEQTRVLEMINNTFYPELGFSRGKVTEWNPNKIEQYGDIYEIIGIILAENTEDIYDITIEDCSVNFEIYEVSEVLK